ncbi:MAG: cytochrome c family protein [Phycisphaerales bacterium]|nr:MAG: cytochrome c family protein [Phycisphaerales bacterium]
MGTLQRGNPSFRRNKGALIIPAIAKQKLIGALFLMGLIAGLSCVPTERRTPPAYRRQGTQAESLTVFFTGGTLGALKPCGCSGGQLGGFERRPAVLNAVPRQRRLAVDIGSFVAGEAEQDLIKYTIILQALRQLDYDVVSLSEKDIDIGATLGELDSAELGFNLIGAYAGADIDLPAKYTKTLALGGRAVAVTIAALKTKSGSLDEVRELFSPQAGAQTLNVLIVDQCSPDIAESVAAAAPSVDCIICPSESDEPIIVGDPDKKPLVFSVGRFGRYVCKLQATTDGSRQALKLSLDVIPVSEDLAKDASLVNLYEDYQQFVKESNLLQKHLRVALPNDLEYVGSASCEPCHDSEYEKWRGTAHASAYATLEKIGSQFDPECVVCHVVGLDYESGFVSAEQTVDLKDVGCENCHGPGSEHNRSGGWAKTTEPKSACIVCHTPEHSGEYAGNERSFREKIVHWAEPNAANHVK